MWPIMRDATIASVMTLVAAAGAHAQTGPRSTRPAGPIVTTDRTLQASLDRIAGESRLWREALGAVSKTGRQAVVVTPHDPIVAIASAGSGRDKFDTSGLAEVIPVVDRNSRVTLVVVIVNLPLIQRTHDRQMSVPRELEDDLDRILVHEVYGHAIPYLLSGDLSGRCADPMRGERPLDACAIQRENGVRAELGLGRRTDDGLSSLALARSRSF